MKQIQKDLMLLGLAGMRLKEQGLSLPGIIKDYRPEAVEALWKKYLPQASLSEQEIAGLAREIYGRLKNKK